jgi:hypothetical protein
LDLAPAGLGFLANVVALPEEVGGVSAGSVESNPKVFFVKDVVAMIERMFGLDGLGWGEGIIALSSNLQSRSQGADQ